MVASVQLSAPACLWVWWDRLYILQFEIIVENQVIVNLQSLLCFLFCTILLLLVWLMLTRRKVVIYTLSSAQKYRMKYFYWRNPIHCSRIALEFLKKKIRKSKHRSFIGLIYSLGRLKKASWKLACTDVTYKFRHEMQSAGALYSCHSLPYSFS